MTDLAAVVDPWVAILRSIAGNDVARSVDEAKQYTDPTAFHVVVARRSAIFGHADHPSLDGLPDSEAVAHWFDGHYIRTEADLSLRFARAEAMAGGLNASEEQEPCAACYDPDVHDTCTCIRPCREPWCDRKVA